MKAFYSIILHELKSVRKEKTIMFAILIQLFIASFSSILLVGLMAFYDPDSIGQNTNIDLRVGVIGDNQNRFTALLRQRNLHVRSFTDADEAERAFKAGTIDTIVFIPEIENNILEMKLVLPEMDSRATIVLMVLRGPLEQYENYLRKQSGVQVRYGDMGGKPYTTYEFLYTLIIPILMFFPAFVAGSMVVDSISEEIQNNTLATLLSAPVSLNLILSAKMAAAVIISIVQCILWVLLLQFNGFGIQNLALVLAFSMIIAATISLAAALISLLFRDRERSQFIYSIIVVIAVGVSFFLDPSPFGMVARLATGDYYLNIGHVMLYLLPPIILAAILPLISKKVLPKVV
jgi:ABC-2 type transport system permease protein